MTIYAGVRVATMLFGWLLALLLGLAGDLLVLGAKWPLFVGIGSWWTLACAMLVRSEARQTQEFTTQDYVHAARQAKAAHERDDSRHAILARQRRASV